MFYKTELKDHIRVPPRFFDLEVGEAVLKCIKLKYDGFIGQDLGIVVDVESVKDIKEGIIIPGDGASYYETVFNVITFKPEMHEVIPGRIKDIADFGAFITMGPMEGMIHISQTMDDFVSFSKDKVLTGKDTKKILKVGDNCKARVIAVSFKDITNPKLGLTMRQPGLGRPDWVEEEDQKEAKPKEEKAKGKKEKKEQKAKKK
jgi:DNA-directed RNA polymerase subunit E'